MNAKEEFLKIKDNDTIKCAYIVYDNSNISDKEIILKKNYTKEDYNKFLEELNFEYDNGFGGQELWGTIWFTNNTWAERNEYDGSEWWELTSAVDEQCQINDLKVNTYPIHHIKIVKK